MPELIFERYATNRGGRENRNIAYFQVKGRIIILNGKRRQWIGKTGNGYCVLFNWNNTWWVGESKKFNPQRLYFNSSDFSCSEADMLRMLYPQYKDIVEDINLLLSLIKSAPVIDNDFEALLSLCNQAQEKHHESQCSIQTS